MNMPLLLMALVVGAAFVCRVDLLTWRGQPVLMALHSLGGIAAAWVLRQSAGGDAAGPDVAILLGAVALLAGTYGQLPTVKGACK